MHIQSNILTFYEDMGGNPVQFPDGTYKIRIEYDPTPFGNQWKIRCYDKKGNRLDSLKFATEE
jgi:hypothetical protein